MCYMVDKFGCNLLNRRQSQNGRPYLRLRKEVRQFLGLASYYCNYLPQFATVASPLIDLTRKRSIIQWNWETQHVFSTIKKVLYQEIRRHAWDITLPTRLTTDASGTGLGAVLEQLHGQEWKTVAV